MPYKPGVPGWIPGFSIKPLSVEPSGVHKINIQIINPPGPVLEKPEKLEIYIFQWSSLCLLFCKTL